MFLVEPIWTIDLLQRLPGWYVYGFAVLIGAFVGSFLNVAIIRIPLEGMSVFSPARSMCFGCDKTIPWYENIPILSFLLLRGRCSCKKYALSLQYPMIELMTAVFAVAAVHRFGASLQTLVLFGFLCALIVVTFIDLAYWIIPDVISIPCIPLAVAAAFFFGPPLFPSWKDSLAGLLVGGGCFWAIHLFYEKVRKRTGLGFGDVKLMAVLGGLVGLQKILLIFLLSSVQGLLAVTFLYLRGWREQAPIDVEEDALTLGRPETVEIEPEAAAASQVEPHESVEEGQGSGEEEEVGWRNVAIPFGPFLSLAALEVIFWGTELMQMAGRFMKWLSLQF